jgi:gliding motility-associated-like protein
MNRYFKILMSIFLSNILYTNITQAQCPSNLSFDANNLSFWTFKTGTYAGFNASSPDYGATYLTDNTFNPVPANVSTLKYYPSNIVNTSYASGNSYNNIYNNGVRIIKANSDNSLIYDTLMSGSTVRLTNVIPQVPEINGYKYPFSVKLGNQHSRWGAEQLVFRFKVPETNPDGSTLSTYNITYAYAVILESALHPPAEQPRFNATVNDLSQPVATQKIECASKQYFVPQSGNDGTWNTISSSSFMYKNWQEVSFDVSQYAGKLIEIKFSVVDCSQGGHGGYAYVALRNDGCGAGTIVGPSAVCASGNPPANITYSTAAVDQASYTWTFPTGWTVSGTSTASTITVRPNSNSGNVTVTPSQSCGNIVTRSLNVTATASAPLSPGTITGSTAVCASSQNLTYRVDPVANATSYSWTLPSGASWVSGYGTNEIVINAPSSTGTGTISVAAVNNCNASSPSLSSVSISVGTNSVGGTISSSISGINCPTDASLTLNGKIGNVLNWDYSEDGGINWAMINSSAGTSSLTVRPTKSTLYRAIVQSDICAPATSSNALINIKSLPSVVTQPSDIGVCENATTSFNTYATGDGLTYNWYVSSNGGTSYTSLTNSGIYTGTTTDNLTLSSPSTSYNNYKYKVLVKGTCDETGVYSLPALLNVYSGSTITILQNPSNNTICQGSTTSLAVTANGPSLGYQWYSNNSNSNSGGTLLTGETRRTYTPVTTTNGVDYYYVKVTSSGSCGTASLTSSAAILTINPTSTISTTISSTSSTICAGTNKIFTATPTNGGSSPVYAWYKNGSVISGQTAATYSTTDLLNGDAIYATVSSNEACVIGSPASSNTISTVVNTLPSVNNITGLSSLNVGSNINLTNTTLNGSWSSATPGVATVSSSGTVTGVSEGNVNIFYSITDNQTPACTNSAIKAITVNALAPSGLSYTTPNVYARGTSITALNPTVSGGAVTGYTITPSLPTGLVINSTTGIISGTPTVISPSTTYTVTATNSGGSVSAGVNLTVNDVAPSGLSYTTPNVYIKGSAITALNPTVSGGAVTGYTITPSLPTGLVINSTTGIISGTPTVNSAATNYTVTASNSGGSVSAVVNITVKLDQPQGGFSSIDYTLLNIDTLQFKVNITEGTSPFTIILTNNQNTTKDTISNLSNGSIFKLKPISKTSIFNLYKLIDAGGSERISGFTKDTSIINIAAPNLALTLKAETPTKQSDNSFKTKLLVKLKNVGEIGLKNVQVNANLSEVFPNYLNYTLDSIKVKSGNIKLNANYTGKGSASTAGSSINSIKQSNLYKSNAGLDANYLLDNGVNLATSEEAEVQYFMSIAATPNSIVLKLQFETEGQAVITKNDGSVSQQISKAISDNGISITSHPNITSVGIPLPTFLPLYPVEKIGVSLSASNASLVSGGYTFDFVAKIKNYSNLNLDTVAILNDLSKTFTSPDTAFVINTPIVTGGIKFNTSFNGFSNTLLIDSSAKLAVGDSATISYTLKVLTDKINYTWLNSLIASGHSTLDYDYINDNSVEGMNPDPNGDKDPLEQTETRFFVSYIRPDAPVVSNVVYTYNTNYPKNLNDLVKSYPTNSIPVWCDLATSICNPVSPSTPTIIGKYVYYLKSYDTTTKLYSLNYVNDTVIIKPPVPVVNDSTYIIGQINNPLNVGTQVKAMTDGSLKYFLKTILLNAIPGLGNTPGTASYTVSQVVNQIESDTASFKVTLLHPNDVMHLQKIAGEAVLQSNSSFNIPFTFIARNVLNKQLDSILITDNLMNSIVSPGTFSVVSLSSTGGLIKNTGFNGKTDINVSTYASKLVANAIDTINLVINVLPNGYTGVLQNTAIINAKTPYGKLSMNSSSKAWSSSDITKSPTPYTIPDLRIDIPEGFSPNRDGVNDKFVIIKPYGTILELEVFNRWGNVVYTNSNYNNDWDGRGTNNFLGQELLDGGYYYSLKAKFANGNVQIFKGFVLIQR